MSPWDQQTSDGADKGRTQTPHTGVQPQELEVARTAAHVADRLTSFFSSRRGTAPCHCTLKCTPKEPRGQAYHSFPLTTFTLRQLDDYACHNGEAVLLTDQVRALEPGTPAYAYAKSNLCSYCPVGVVSPFRAQRFMAVNGLACYELDYAYDVAAAREALEADPSIARAALSPGGRGFHVVIPVAPEPTSVSELQWALARIHDHLVYRYGPLFGKIDRGLTSGIELHYVASDPTRIFRETALPLMTGAPRPVTRKLDAGWCPASVTVHPKGTVGLAHSRTPPTPTPLPGGTGHGSGYGPHWNIWPCPTAAATTCGSRRAFAWSERSWRAGRYTRSASGPGAFSSTGPGRQPTRAAPSSTVRGGSSTSSLRTSTWTAA